METAEVERRSTAETELDLPTESHGKMIDIILMINTFINKHIIEMDEIITDSEVERRSTAETELDLPTESLGKIIDII